MSLLHRRLQQHAQKVYMHAAGCGNPATSVGFLLEARAAQPTQSCTRQQVQEGKANTRENEPMSLFVKPGHKVMLLHASAFLGDPKGDKKGTRR